MTLVPFAIASDLSDSYSVAGQLSATPGGLLIEYQGFWIRYDDEGKETSKQEWPATELMLPYASVARMELGHTWLWRPLIRMSVTSLKSWSGFPLATGVQAEIPVARAYRSAARELVAEVNLQMAEAAVRQIEGR